MKRKKLNKAPGKTLYYICMGGKCDRVIFGVSKQLRPESLVTVENEENDIIDEYYVSENWSQGFCVVYSAKDLNNYP